MERTITQIVNLTKIRSKIYINYEFAFILYKAEIKRYKIKLNESISEDNYNELVDEVLSKRAKKRCLNLLLSRNYSSSELAKKLSTSYPKEVVDNAIAYVKSYGYIDDEAYVESYIRCNSCIKSLKRIEYDLQNKGIQRDIINRHMSEFVEENDGCEQEIITRILKKKLLSKTNIENIDKKEVDKVKMTLYRKGFSIDSINSCINKMKVEYISH